MTKSKKLLACLLIIIPVLTFSYIHVHSEESREIIIDSVTATKTGHCEVIGHYTNAPLDTQITCLAGSEKLFDGNTVVDVNFNMDNVAYIDQVGTGNNGTFLIQFSVDKKWSKKTLVIKGATSYGDSYTTTIELPEIPPGIEIINNNSVLYGRDAYYVPGLWYTPNNIAASIAFGGNNVYFKIGDKWYDLMDEDAVDNSYLTTENAVTNAQIEKLKPRYYRGLILQTELIYSLE